MPILKTIQCISLHLEFIGVTCPFHLFVLTALPCLLKQEAQEEGICT